MRRRVTAILLLVAAVLAMAAPVSAREVIKSFHADIQVAKSGKLDVTETITVLSENDQIRHGIYRDFPLTFIGADKEMHRVDFKILDIRRDGEAEEYKTSGLDNGVRILIGKADFLLDQGEHIYTIRYETDRQIRYFADHDELYWNVTGNGWAFPINAASATVTLPVGVRSQANVGYTGALGSTAQDVDITESGARIVFATTTALDVHGGLTIDVQLAKGAISPPLSSAELWWAIHDRMNTITAGSCLAVLLLFFAGQWYRVGRDPAKGVVVPRWDAPDGLSPALVNYIDQKGFIKDGWTAFSASTVSLAVKGLLRLEDLHENVTLKATGVTPHGDLPLGEDKIYDAVTKNGGYLMINKASGPRIQSLGETFRTAIEKQHFGKYYRYNLPIILAGIALTAAACAIILFVSDFTKEMMALFIVPAAASLVLTFISGAIAGSVLSSRSPVVRGIGWIIISVIWALYAFFLFSSISAVRAEARSPDDVMGYIAGCAMLVVAAFFIAIMGSATPLGRKLADGIEGLRLYLTVAEKDRMNMAGAPQMSPQHYETLLPYAVALGVEKPWSNQFQTWLAAAAGAAAAYQPAWFIGDDLDHRNYGQRISSFSSSLNSTIVSSLPPPPSSSSSGSSSGGSSSGSSGGGGGGGGGGGW